MLCLFFIVIGGVSASDVLDMSDNPDNNDPVSESIDSVSEESVDNYCTDQLSNEAGSSVNPSTGDDSHEAIFDDTQTNNAASSPTVKSATSLKVSSTKIYSGQQITITLKDKNGKALKGKKILLNVPSKKAVFTKTTDSKGQVKFTFYIAGSFKSYVSFNGDSSYKASKINYTLKVLKSSTSLKIKNTTVPRSTALIVTLKNTKSGNTLSGKKVIFKIPKWKKTYVRYTDSKGQAKLTVNTKNKFYVIVSYGGKQNLYKSNTSATIRPTSCKTKLDYSTKNLEYGQNFVITLRKQCNNAGISNQVVKVNITNKNKVYTKKTNSKGQISIPMNYLGTVDMKINYAGKDMFIKSSAKPKVTVSKGTTSFKDSGSNIGQGFTYVVTLKSSAGKALANQRVIVTFNNKTMNKTTNSKGQLSFVMNYKKGSYPIAFDYSGNKYYNPSKISKTIKVVDPYVSISKIVTAARDLKVSVEYVNILNNAYTVTIDNRKYTMDEFSYLMAGALTNINKGSKANALYKDLSNKYNSSGAKIDGKLYKSEYLKLANNLTKYVNSNNHIPTNLPTTLGKVEANLYIYSLASALDFYGKNKRLPSYITLKTSYVRGGYSISLSQTGKILNYRQSFDSSAFAKYLKTGGKSALTDDLKKKARELTAGLSSPKAKANAIFEFVRDEIKYSFYTNSLKGASKTLSSRSGNCCDKANLIVAMCRSVGIYARYSHAKNCHFASGLNTGHVWAQVYDPISQTWYTADATSRRNNLGDIKNWNTKSYTEPKNYALIPF